MFNHLEYGGQTLTREFQRDFYAGKPVEEPQNLMENTDPGNSIDYSWRDTGTIFFANWIKTFAGSNVADTNFGPLPEIWHVGTVPEQA